MGLTEIAGYAHFEEIADQMGILPDLAPGTYVDVYGATQVRAPQMPISLFSYRLLQIQNGAASPRAMRAFFHSYPDPWHEARPVGEWHALFTRWRAQQHPERPPEAPCIG
ncbi:MAG TPA: hypothetical protein VNL71_14980 [Chloroflexota bacterium]|nr:hypothetical protein [Chloroflexota bacterium]